MRVIMVLGTIVVGSYVIGLFLRFIARWRLFHDRQVKPMEELHKTLPSEIAVPIGLFRDIITLVADCYHLHPGLLRMDDDFEGNLAAWDSWYLGGAAEDLAERITRDLQIDLPDQPRIRTVGELVCFVMCSQRSCSPS